MPSRQLDFPVFDADNHMYETREALTSVARERYSWEGVARSVAGATQGRLAELAPIA